MLGIIAELRPPSSESILFQECGNMQNKSSVKGAREKNEDRKTIWVFRGCD